MDGQRRYDLVFPQSFISFSKAASESDSFAGLLALVHLSDEGVESIRWDCVL